MKKLVAFTAMATTALMMFDVDIATAHTAVGGVEDAAAAAARGGAARYVAWRQIAIRARMDCRGHRYGSTAR